MKRRSCALIVMTAVAYQGLAIAGDTKNGAAGPGVDIAALPVAVEGIDTVQGGVFRDGRVYVSGQPDEAALQEFRDLGVTAVVNLRTPAEMDDRERVPFDEAAALADLGIDYVHIPLGGSDHPYTPEAVAGFAAVLEAHPGPVLLHCTVAWRASYFWAAYLVLYQDFSLDDTVKRGEAIAISPSPLEGLLGQPLALRYED